MVIPETWPAFRPVEGRRASCIARLLGVASVVPGCAAGSAVLPAGSGLQLAILECQRGRPKKCPAKC